MKLEKYDKQLKIDGILSFEFKELGKMHQTTEDITTGSLQKLLKENNIPDGVYFIKLLDRNWQRTIYWRNKGRYNIQTYRPDIVYILEGDNPYEALCKSYSREVNEDEN